MKFAILLRGKDRKHDFFGRKSLIGRTKGADGAVSGDPVKGCGFIAGAATVMAEKGAKGVVGISHQTQTIGGLLQAAVCFSARNGNGRFHLLQRGSVEQSAVKKRMEKAGRFRSCGDKDSVGHPARMVVGTHITRFARFGKRGGLGRGEVAQVGEGFSDKRAGQAERLADIALDQISVAGFTGCFEDAADEHISGVAILPALSRFKAQPLFPGVGGIVVECPGGLGVAAESGRVIG